MKIKRPKKYGFGRSPANVPVIMQLETLECGAACLDMVLAYYGRFVPLEDVRSICGVSRDGSNARNILRAARSYGLEAKGFRAEPHELRKEGTFPCIIHWNYDHFVVLNGFSGRRAVINDPARGTVTVSEKEFDSSFTGVVLMMEPGKDFEPGGHRRHMIGYAAHRMKSIGSAVIFLTVTTVLTSVITMIEPGFLRFFSDRLLTGIDTDMLIPFLALFSVVALAKVVTGWVKAVYSLRINGRMAVDGTSAFMWQVLRLPVSFFSQRMAGDIQQRQHSNGRIAFDMVNTLAPLVLDTAMMIFYLGIMLRYSVFLSCIGVLSVLFDLLVSDMVSRRRINLTRVQLRDQGRLAGILSADMEMIETIKASGVENGCFMQWADCQADVVAQNMRYARLNAVIGTVPELVSTLSSQVILVLGVLLVLDGRFTEGMVMAFSSYLTAFTAPATSLIGAGQSLQEMRSEIERVEDVMSHPTDPLTEERESPAEESEKLSGNVEIRNVTFGYSPLDEPLIENFSMSIPKGSKVAFVGASGCGKSTLSKLISGLYRPWSGEILFDGKPVDAYDRQVFTGSLAVVDQDITLFEDTIANNLRMWDSTIEDFEMIMAARDARIHQDIMQREGGYEYVLSENGSDLSGGQRQRLELARVLAQDPTILIMDEATSALDARTEYEAVKAISDRGITCIVIAHRLSTIRDCNEIVVLDKGKVAERGTHEELFAKGGLYTRLVSEE